MSLTHLHLDLIHKAFEVPHGAFLVLIIPGIAVLLTAALTNGITQNAGRLQDTGQVFIHVRLGLDLSLDV